MARARGRADTVRASRDGHEYHEAWTARKAMQLLLGDAQLVGIAVEGLEPGDQACASSETVEVADLTLYYGKATGFELADKVDVVQFKYSPSNGDVPFRASDAKKTVAKFAASYRDYKRRSGARQVREKLSFELTTNRPIYPPLAQAIAGLAEQRIPPGKARHQAAQFRAAAGLDDLPLAEFARKFHLLGSSGSLVQSKRSLAVLLADWSATSDAVAGARLGQLREMVRNKAGSAGAGRNVIRRADVLAALGLQDEDELLPCPARVPEIEHVVSREQLPEVLGLIPTLAVPLLIHSAGGLGKTVFMKTLEAALSDRYEAVFFDCFGGGSYRSPEDARHLPKRGLLQIANSFSCRGLCDPILPGSNDLEALLSAFRRRLEQCVKTLGRTSPKRGLLILLDAIDNATEHAKDRGEDAFPTLLLESLQGRPIQGLTVVASSRSHRIPIRDIPHCEFELRPFSPVETVAYLQSRMSRVSASEGRVAQARSGGNPRILEHLVTGGQGLLEPSEINKRVELADLIQGRLDRALREARERGNKPEVIDAFLAGLAVLPPPVPQDEYAEAHGMEPAAIESFVSDMWPLLERTRHGLMFRDEPTETLVRDKYASKVRALRSVASNLMARQDRSTYAARALPGLLQRLGDGRQLFTLAFDERFPVTATSGVGKRSIRYARLKAAVHHAATQGDYDQLVHLLLELSSIAAVDHRGAEYILGSPDLVIAAGDADASRRLFEMRTVWPGTRHASLTIANALSGDLDEATRHALRASEWFVHFLQEDRDRRRDTHRPTESDAAAVPFLLSVQGRNDDAIRGMRRWKDWFAYEAGERLLGMLEQRGAALGSPSAIKGFVAVLSKEIGCIAAALSFLEMGRDEQVGLIHKLARACARGARTETSDDFRGRRLFRLQDGLRKAAGLAAMLGLKAAAGAIGRRTPHKRPDTWSFEGRFSDQYVFPYLFHVALTAAMEGRKVREKDVLPTELVPVCRGIKNTVAGDQFRLEVRKRLEERWKATQSQRDKGRNAMTHEQKGHAEGFIERRLAPTLELTNALAAVVRARAGAANKPFRTFLDAWATARSKPDYYGRHKQDPFVQRLGCEIAAFALWLRSDLRSGSVRAFLQRLHEQEIVPTTVLIEVTAVLAKRPLLQALAGEVAVKARAVIETESDLVFRSSLLAQLARAILPASKDEATAYFKAGLEQLEAIGSGDYQFTNELLLFAASLKGRELDEQDFHVLTNICELNLTDEPEKFPWDAFGNAMSRVSGCRGLAKLSRWDDRSRVPLRYTLLPYLTALVEEGKLAAADALAMNRLARPAEFWSCNTGTLATAIVGKQPTESGQLVLELIEQFEESNPGELMDSTMKALAEIATTVLGGGSEVAKRLARTHPQIARMREERNDHQNYHGRASGHSATTTVAPNAAGLREIARRTDPADATSLELAITDLGRIAGHYSRQGELLQQIRAKVQFKDRMGYLRAVSSLGGLSLYDKIEELQGCRTQWGTSSAALEETYQAAACSLLANHVNDLVLDGHLHVHQLAEISALSGLSKPTLALRLVRHFSDSDSVVTSAVWLALSRFMCEAAREREGHAALKRLLNSGAAKLSATVVDGEWKDGTYPHADAVSIAAGLVWRMLGSPSAADRWHAAHSMRRFAKFGQWSILDAVVGMLDREDARSFQAPELRFYCMHARLWLLIALARIALDEPKAVARHESILLDIVRNRYGQHVLLRHFAARALITCLDANAVDFPPPVEALVRNIDRSPRPRSQGTLDDHEDFYSARPATARRPKWEFSLDYDFHKLDVQGLRSVFGKRGWEVSDRLSEIVRALDPEAKSMYQAGGREGGSRSSSLGMTSGYHTYGQQLGWHALHLAAGEYLNTCSVSNNQFNSDPWADWLGGYLLTRSDGLWLADGLDRVPLDAVVNLLEEGDKALVLTGDREKLFRLVGINSGSTNGVVVSGAWHTLDHVRVRVSSALVSSRSAPRVAKALVNEEPMRAWLPEYEESDQGEEYVMSGMADCVPWVVRPSVVARLDEDDPLGSVHAVRRPRIAATFTASLGVCPADPFGRQWRRGTRGATVARAEAWGHENRFSDEPTASGVRLACHPALLKRVLTVNRSELIILLKLERYEKAYLPHSESKFTHTVAVIRVDGSLDFTYYRGCVNYPHKNRY